MKTHRRTTHGLQKVSYPQRGEIYLKALDPTLGRKIKRTRPALIIYIDVANRLSDIAIVAQITSSVVLQK